MSFQSAFAPTEDVLLSSPSPSVIRLSKTVLPTMEVSSTGKHALQSKRVQMPPLYGGLVRLWIAECAVFVGISAGQLAQTALRSTTSDPSSVN